MVKSTPHEIVIAFDGVEPGGAEAARRMIPTIPALVGSPLLECELCLDRARSALFLAFQLEDAASEGCLERLRFWAARARGAVLITGTAAAAVLAHWRARLAGCARRRRCAGAEGLAATVDALLGRAPRPADRTFDRPTLPVDIGGPGSDGIAFNARDRLLFVPGQLSPPVGDELELALSIRGAEGQARCWARVVRVRGAAARAGAPAGFVLQLGALPARAAAALATSCVAMNADAMVEEARRSAPRYAVRLGVELRRLGPRSASAGSGPGDAPPASAVAQVVSLSIGGAFVETASAPPVGSQVSVRFLHPDGGLDAVATVVYATATGTGVKFHLTVDQEAFLGRLIARLSARPRRALVVDDDALARRLIGDALAELDYDVLTASGGDEAVRVLASELYALDAVVTDLRMDGVDGSQLVQALDSARDHVQLAVVVVSGSVDPEDVERLTGAGADAVLEKCVEPDRIAADVDALVDLVRAERRPAGGPHAGRGAARAGLA